MRKLLQISETSNALISQFDRSGENAKTCFIAGYMI